MRLFIFCAGFLLAVTPGAAAQLPPPEMPPVLIAGPINATWAADNLAFWREKGFKGFIFSGILDAITTDIWTLDAQPQTTQNEDLLTREVLAANNRLIDGAIDRNFLLIPLSPEQPYFISGDITDAAVTNVSHAASFCRITGLRGICFDTRPSNLFYDFRWGGYDYNAYSQDDLVSGAERFGRRMARAVIREIPAAEIFLVTDAYETWAPLWVALINGFVDAMTAAPDASIHLLLQSTFYQTNPATLTGELDTAARVLNAHLNVKKRSLWQKQGYFSVGMQPLMLKQTANGNTPAAAYPMIEFQKQLVAAKLLSGRYCWIKADVQTWWGLTEQDLAKYAASLSGPPLQAQVRPNMPELDQYAVKSPLDEFTRVGPYTFNDTPCFVLTGQAGTALVFQEGVRGKIEFRIDRKSVRQTTLVSQKASTEIPAENGPVSVPPTSEPILLDGLPTRPYALSAALWSKPLQQPEYNSREAQLTYGFSARSGLRVAGTLKAEMPQNFSIQPPEIPLELENGQSAVINAVVHGRFTLGLAIDYNVTLILPLTSPVTRQFHMTIGPQELWNRSLDGTLSASPVCMDVNRDGSSEIFADTVTGQLACLSATGSLSWSRRFSTGFRSQVIVIPGEFGRWLVAASDNSGRLRVLDSQGLLVWEKELNGESLMPGPIAARIGESPGEDMLIAFSDGRVVALQGNGQQLWQKVTDGKGPGWLIAVPMLAKNPLTILVARSGPPPYLDCLNANGDTRWKTALADGPASAPIIIDINGDNAADIVVPLQNGTFQAFDPGTGASVLDGTLPVDPPLRSLAAVELVKNKGIDLLAAGQTTIAALDKSLNVLWTRQFSLQTTPTTAASSSGSLVLLPLQDGRLICLDGKGQFLWEDNHAAAPAAVPPALAQLRPGGAPETLLPTRDRFIRALYH